MPPISIFHFPVSTLTFCSFQVGVLPCLSKKYIYIGNKGVYTLCNACSVVYRTLCGTVAKSKSQYVWETKTSFEILVHYTKRFAVIPLSDICFQMHPESLFADFDKCLILKPTGFDVFLLNVWTLCRVLQLLYT